MTQSNNQPQGASIEVERVDIIDRIEAIIDSTMIFRHSAEGKAIGSLLKQLRTARRTPAATTGELPPLPPHIEVGGEGWGIEDFMSWKTFTVDDMQAYARAAIEADRAQRQAAPTQQNQTPDLNVLRPFAAPASQHDAAPLPARRFHSVNGFWDADYVEFTEGSERGGGVLDGVPHHKHYTRHEAEAYVAEGAWREVAVPQAGRQSAPAGAARQGGNTNTPLAYIPPHIMESLRNGCRVGTVLEPKPENGCTEALYG